MTMNQTSEVLDRELFPDVTLDQALGFHLGSRCFPPPHPDFYPAIKQAIQLVAQDIPTSVVLPTGRVMAATEVVDKLRLGAFVEQVIAGDTFAEEG